MILGLKNTVTRYLSADIEPLRHNFMPVHIHMKLGMEDIPNPRPKYENTFVLCVTSLKMKCIF